MDVIVVVIIGWLISSFVKNAKKKAQQAASKMQGEQGVPAPKPQRRSRPVRPSDVDLPGQTSMPIHWDGMDEADSAPKKRTYELEDIMLAWSEPAQTMAPRVSEEPLSTWQEQPKQGSATIPGLNLSFTGDTLVQGVIFSEILDRKPLRRRR